MAKAAVRRQKKRTEEQFLLSFIIQKRCFPFLNWNL